MNLLSLVGPRLDNIYQIRRKWYYLSGWKKLQSKRGPCFPLLLASDRHGLYCTPGPWRDLELGRRDAACWAYAYYDGEGNGRYGRESLSLQECSALHGSQQLTYWLGNEHHRLQELPLQVRHVNATPPVMPSCSPFRCLTLLLPFTEHFLALVHTFVPLHFCLRSLHI